MAIEFKDLPYDLEALEPHISRETMNYHYGKHHAKYVETLNRLIKGTPYDQMPLVQIIQVSFAESETKIFNNAAQAWNHDFFWQCLSPAAKKTEPSKILSAIKRDFGSMEIFLKDFKEQAVALFGSGWAWLVKDAAEHLSILPLKDAENPLVYEMIPVLTCDVWEHAYYLDYKNDRAAFVDEFFNLINWDFAEQNYAKKFESPQYIVGPSAADVSQKSR